MLKFFPTRAIVVLLVFGLAACSSDDDDDIDIEPSNESSDFSDQAPESINTGEPGGDISAIAGLWDGSNTDGEVADIVYWNMAANGVLTRYDYQQDGVAGASGDNCYIIGDPITVSPEDDNSLLYF